MEAALADQSIGAVWGCYGTDITGADGTTVGTGAQNTANIVAECDSTPDNAAEITDAYELNGYTDWFLPSKDELNLLYLQKDVVGGFSGSYYWTSSSDDTTGAWVHNFFNGAQFALPKDTGQRVRAVRAF